MHQPAAGETRVPTWEPTTMRGFTSLLSDYPIITNSDVIKLHGRAWLWWSKDPSASGPSASRASCLSLLRARRSLCVRTLLAAHEAVLGPGDHPPTAVHPSIPFPNMATSFSFNHPQNCSWDFRNVSFHCVCLIMLPGGAAGLRKAAMPLKWRNGHDTPHREHLGDRVWE